MVSHPQATAQCARFLRERLPRRRACGRAAPRPTRCCRVRDAGEPRRRAGLAAGRRALRLRGAGRATWRTTPTTSRASCGWPRPARCRPRRAGAAKTSIVFWGGGDESPGWLVDVLARVSGRGVNLTRIESRPRRVRLGHYMFFADLEGRPPTAGERGPGGAARPGGGGARAGLLPVTGDGPADWTLGYTAAHRGAARELTFSTEAGDSEPGPVSALPGPAGLGSAAGSSGRVLVLNASYEPINVCTVRRAAVLILKNRAEVLEQGEWALHAESLTLAAPGGHPAADLRAHPARRPPAQDHPPRGVRPRPLDLPVLRPRARQPHRRPRDPALEGRRLRRGTTSSPAARPATGARATACPGRPTWCRVTAPEGAQLHDLHPRGRARPSPRPGSSTSWPPMGEEQGATGRMSRRAAPSDSRRDQRPATVGPLQPPPLARWSPASGRWPPPPSR